MFREIITRRHLPHWFVPGAAHFVTYRLAGTIPQTVLDDMKKRREVALKQRPQPGIAAATFKERVHKQFFAEFDRLLDGNRDIQWLADPRVAATIRENLFHHQGTKYELLSYCVMPNHVHALFWPIAEETKQLERPDEWDGELADESSPLADIMHSLKSYTASQANKILGRSGPFWQSESYDHWVRDDDELERIVEYIAANPVRAGLVREAHEWFFCSAHDRYLQDGTRAGWLLS